MKAEEGFPMKNFKGYIEVLQALLLGFLYPDRVRPLLLQSGGDDFLRCCVPKCSIVDNDAIAPRKLCLGDGSFSCPLFVRIHHAKREPKLLRRQGT